MSKSTTDNVLIGVHALWEHDAAPERSSLTGEDAPVYRIGATLSSALGSAVRTRLITDNPCRYALMPRPATQERICWNPTQAAAFLRHKLGGAGVVGQRAAEHLGVPALDHAAGLPACGERSVQVQRCGTGENDELRGLPGHLLFAQTHHEVP